jgi:hypothetical protein
MSNNGFKAISESLITDIQECPITRGELGTFTYLMLKANYVTKKALGSFSSMAEDLKVDDRQIARDCHNLRNYGWIDFEVKQGQRKPIKFAILKGWWDNEQTFEQLRNNSQVETQHRNNSEVSPKSVRSQLQHRNNSEVSPKSLRSQSEVNPKLAAPPDTPGSVPMPNYADLVSADNTEHGTQNMKQQRLRVKERDSEDDKDVVVSSFCYEEEPVDPGRKESPYVIELCELFANAYGETLPEKKAQEWILEYGINRCKEIITKGNPDPDNPIGYVQKALKDFWQFKDHRAKRTFDIATPSIQSTRALIDDIKATWAAYQNPTAEEIAKIDAMLINAGLKDPP